eukprot:GEMP01004476.1.p1 GENE.GEMP01004476.1~~GEMP01004476.1.p1  ORF type:complete len:848 (+),score=237.29 GEMP01004476.1:297-2840(+)
MITGLLSRLRAGEITRNEYFSQLDRVQKPQQQPPRASPAETKTPPPLSSRSPPRLCRPPLRNNAHHVDHQYHRYDGRNASPSPSPRLYRRAAPQQHPPPALNLSFRPPHRPRRRENDQAPYERGHNDPWVTPSSTPGTGRFANPREHLTRLRRQAEQDARYDDDVPYESDNGEREWQQQQHADTWYPNDHYDEDHEARPPQRYMQQPLDGRWREDATPLHIGDGDRARHSTYWNPRNVESPYADAPSTNSRSVGYTTPHSGVNTTRSGVNSSSYSDARTLSYLAARRRIETEVPLADPPLSAWARSSSCRLSPPQRSRPRSNSITPAWFASPLKKHSNILAPQLDLPPFLERNSMWNDLRESKLEIRRLAKQQDELAMCQLASRRASSASWTGRKRVCGGKVGAAGVQTSQWENRSSLKEPQYFTAPQEQQGQQIKRRSLQNSPMKRSSSASFLSSQGSTNSRLYMPAQSRTSLRSSGAISRAKQVLDEELSACTFFPNISRSRRSFEKTQIPNRQRAQSAPSSLFFGAAPSNNCSRSTRDPKKDSRNEECVFVPAVNQPQHSMHSCHAYLKNNVFDRLHWTKAASSGASTASQPTQSGRTSTSRGSVDTLRSFLQRQNDCDFVRAERLMEADSEAYADAVYTPEINQRSRYLAERRRTPNSFARVGYDFGQGATCEAGLRAMELSKSGRQEDGKPSGENHTFAPQINRQSSYLPSRGAAAMHDDHEQKLHRSASRRALHSMREEEESPGHKFAFEPTLTTRGHLASGRVPWRKSTREYANSVAEAQEYKSRRSELIRRQQEKKVDAECTFRPRLRCRPVGSTPSQEVAEVRALYRSLKGEPTFSSP